MGREVFLFSNDRDVFFRVAMETTDPLALPDKRETAATRVCVDWTACRDRRESLVWLDHWERLVCPDRQAHPAVDVAHLDPLEQLDLVATVDCPDLRD